MERVMATKLRRRLHKADFGTIGPDGTGVVTTKGGTFIVKFRITRAFPRGAYYDQAGKAYIEPAPPRKSIEQVLAETDPAMEPVVESISA